MARYHIRFSNEWVRGRWGFIDRTIYLLGGKVNEPTGTDNAWLVEFRGKPQALGNTLTELLNIRSEHFHQFGTIFEITEVRSSKKKSSRRRTHRDTISQENLSSP